MFPARTLITAVLAAISTIGALAPRPAETVEAPATPISTTVPPSTTVSTTSAPPIVQITTTSTSTTTTTEPLPEGKCSEWYESALDVGWPREWLPLMGRIAWAESRCLPDVYGTGALGIMQMQWNAHRHWMATEFGITTRDDLYDPVTNLTTALWLARYAEEHYGCWAQPWYMSGDWC